MYAENSWLWLPKFSMWLATEPHYLGQGTCYNGMLSGCDLSKVSREKKRLFSFGLKNLLLSFALTSWTYNLK